MYVITFLWFDGEIATSILHPYINNYDFFEGSRSSAVNLDCIHTHTLYKQMCLVGRQSQQELITDILKYNHTLSVQ